jgi:hypothetical protein
MIKKFKEFINEEISLVGNMGPAYGKQVIPNTINKSDTNVIFCEIDNKFYTEDMFNNLYNQYLIKSKKKSVPKIFSTENIESILNEIGID